VDAINYLFLGNGRLRVRFPARQPVDPIRPASNFRRQYDVLSREGRFLQEPSNGACKKRAKENALDVGRRTGARDTSRSSHLLTIGRTLRIRLRRDGVHFGRIDKVNPVLVKSLVELRHTFLDRILFSAYHPSHQNERERERSKRRKGNEDKKRFSKSPSMSPASQPAQPASQHNTT